MLILLSPAKKLNFDAPASELPATRPALLADADRLSAVARDLGRADLARLMGISDELANLNFERFQAFRRRGGGTTKQAALAFAGDVYQGLDASTLSADDLDYAQDHLRILSGLYGALRPLDAIQPYRLEMGTKLATPKGEDLYDYWGDKIAKELNKAVKDHAAPVIVNLASNEYFKSVDRAALSVPVVTPIFKEVKDGKMRVLMFYAKRARGAMARHIIQNRIESVDALKDVRLDGYRFQPDLSGDAEWVFTRPQPLKKAA